MTFSEDDLILLAASGDAEGQRLLAGHILYGLEGVPDAERLVGAEILARMAASGGQVDHRTALAAVLCLRSHCLARDGAPERAAAMYAEAIGILEELAGEGVEYAAISYIGMLSALADDGDEQAAMRLNEAVEKYGPSVAGAAKLLITEPMGEA